MLFPSVDENAPPVRMSPMSPMTTTMMTVITASGGHDHHDDDAFLV